MTGGSDAYETLHKLDPLKTVVIAFVFPRYPRETLEIIEYLKARKFNFFTVTDSRTLESWGVCECTLVTPISMTTLFDSYITSYCLANILLDYIGRVDKKKTKMMLEQLERLFKEKDLFYKKE